MARGLDPVLAARVATLIADAIGSDGLIAGQAEDLAATEREISFETLERIHRRKTGALFSAAAVAGALTAGAPPSQIAALEAYAKNLGLAFQIVDDLLDVEGDPAETGKRPGRISRKRRSSRSAASTARVSLPASCAPRPMPLWRRSAPEPNHSASFRPSLPRDAADRR